MTSLKSKVESLLFITSRPLATKKIAELLKVKPDEARLVLSELYQDYQVSVGGIKLLKTKDEWQFGTSPENSSVVSQFLQEELSGELTRPQLETLTIIAYRGPITKMEIEQIRGINCSLILRNLLIRGLVEGREEGKNKASTYQATMDFLRFLGLTSVVELPNYKRLRSNEVIDIYLKENQKYVV